MKFLLIGSLALLVYRVQATANCLSCKLNDMTAPLLVSYSYCPTTDACLEDKWNYIDMPCKNSSWERGVLMSLDSCNPVPSTTNTDGSFQSTELAAGVW